MTAAILSIRAAGPLVTIQDGGRRGLMRFGVPHSGPMDRLAFAAANRALGNAPNAPVIEVSLAGLSLSCEEGEVGMAVAGGGFIVDHAGHKGGSWQVLTLRAGQVLRIRPGFRGSWCYLALAGALEAQEWLGSASTHTMSGLGGGALVPGQVLTVRDARRVAARDLPCPLIARPRPVVHVTKGPQDRYFSAAAWQEFMQGDWRLTSSGDRMGVRLSGPLLVPQGPLDMPSEPVVRGSVQVAGDGVATVLLADHQTTGGYPRIATVLDCDLDGLAQLRPRDRLRFIPVTGPEAVAMARSRTGVIARFLEGIDRLASPD